jgi:hypothetical protein
MSTARSELLIYVGAALATVTGLFVLHFWYASFLDNRYHAQLAERGPAESLLAAREEEQKALGSGKVPLSQAISGFSRGVRPASVTPAPSEDLSAVSGWIHARGFKPATAHPVRVAKSPKPAAAPAPAPEPAAAPPPAATPEPAPKAARQLKIKTAVARPQGAR